MSNNLIEITDQNFDEQVLKSPIPILVDFWAEWCGPCKMITPILEEIAVELKGEVCIGKMNVDENSQIPGSLGIRGIPTLILYSNGEVKTTQVGALSKSDLINLIKSNI